MEHNGQDGLAVFTDGTHFVNVTVNDSVAANNTGDGIVVGSDGGPANVMVRNATISNNGGDGLDSQGTGTTIRVTRSTITSNNGGWTTSAGGVVTSYADNNIDGNAFVNTEPPSPATYKSRHWLRVYESTP